MVIRNLRQRAVTLAVTGVLASAGAVAVTGTPALADGYIQYGCTAYGDEVSPYYTGVDEISGNCDLVQARTYTYVGGGTTTSTYGSQGYTSSTAYKASSGTYSGGAGRVRFNGSWTVWVAL